MNLYLQEFNGLGQNPCCETKNYRSNVLKALPGLNSLDGQRKAIKAIDMKNIGLDGDDNEEEPGYDMQDEDFFNSEI